MRIWFPAIRAGSGTDVFTERLASALRSAGAEADITWYPHRYEFWPGFMRNAAPMPDDVDVIHVNSWTGSEFLQMGKPVVVTVHHLVHDPAYAPYRSFLQTLYHHGHIKKRERAAIQHAAIVTTVSGYVAKTVSRFSGRGDIEVIHNWVDTSRYLPSENYSFDEKKRFRLLMVGNLGRRKGSDLLAPFMSLLGDSFELRCTGGLRNADKGKIANVTWLGHLSENELIGEYQQCDAVLSLSRYEGFGYTALEAMACGKPFVGFDTSGLAEVVKQNVTGILVPIDDINALVHQCNLLRKDHELRKRLANEARQTAVNDFSETSAISNYFRVYEDAMHMHK